MPRVLLAGESWVSQATHFKGFDSFTSVTFHTGADVYLSALRAEGIQVDQMFAHDVPEQFPYTVDELRHYDVVILSDVGVNSFLLPPATWLEGRSMPNRLETLRSWVEQGGGLMMAGGYLSFQGFQARANYARSALAEILPVVMSDYDDRVEAPQGVRPALTGVTHPVAAAWQGEAPALLGYNRVSAKPGAEVVATVGEDVLIATAVVGAGRTLAWTSDIGPHWCPTQFCEWSGFASLMAAMVRWLSREL